MADAVVNPWAVVVHLEDAELAFAAVMSSSGLPSLFACALFAVLDFHVLTLERRGHAFLNAAWTAKRSSDVTEVRHYAEAIERNKVEESFCGQGNTLDELVLEMVFAVPVEDVRSVSHVLPE